MQGESRCQARLTSEWTELSAFLNERVEEAETEQEFAPTFGFITGVEERLIVDGIVQVRTKKIGSQAFRTFVGHLDAIL